MTDEQWPDDGTPVLTVCDHCGERRLCVYRADPFHAAVYPETTPEESYWCRPCYDRRGDDI